MMKTRVLGGFVVAAVALSVIGGLASPASADVSASPLYSIDTGMHAYDGGCQARTIAEFWRGPTGANEVRTTTWVTSPYWFSGCQVNVDVRLPSVFGWSFSGAHYRASACAVLDPTCPSSNRQTGTFRYTDPVPAGYSVLISGIQVDHSRA